MISRYLSAMSQTSPDLYPGSAHHPDLPSGKAAGRIELTATGVRFESGGHSFTLPWQGLVLRAGGENDTFVFLSHPSQPRVTFYTAERALLDHPRLASDPALAQQVAALRSKKRRGRMSCGVAIFVTVALLAILFGSLFFFKEAIVAAVARRVPPGVETRIGDLVFEQVRTTQRLVEDPDLQARLGRLMAPLMAGVRDSRYPFSFHVVDDPTVNAFALPGGHVVLHSGLLLRAERPEEVLGVLGHEVAHVTRRHSLREIIQSAGLVLLAQALFGDLEGLLALAAEGGTRLLDLRFSRDFEREADDAGWEYLTTAGIDPTGLISFFEKLKADERDQLGSAADAADTLSFLSTHPASQERIERLRRKLEEVRGRRWKALDVDFAGLQERVRQVTSPPA
jgi:Zn-dependent protease with chaperone function